ncbi:hypothetical protein GBA52_011846 [Prunus armeniaca]|nr:hypothetical protein GBA52_011846 [Prunus armeniaca]
MQGDFDSSTLLNGSFTDRISSTDFPSNIYEVTGNSSTSCGIGDLENIDLGTPPDFQLAVMSDDGSASGNNMEFPILYNPRVHLNGIFSCIFFNGNKEISFAFGVCTDFPLALCKFSELLKCQGM